MTLVMTSLLETVCYMAALFSAPTAMPRIANEFGHAVQHLYFTVAAPGVFLPLGAVLLSSRILPRAYGLTAFCLGGTFFALGIACLSDLVLPNTVTALAAVQALWWLLAAATLILKAPRLATSPHVGLAA